MMNKIKINRFEMIVQCETCEKILEKITFSSENIKDYLGEFIYEWGSFTHSPIFKLKCKKECKTWILKIYDKKNDKYLFEDDLEKEIKLGNITQKDIYL